jgi:uncharacterized caspase-like protein
MAPHTRHTQRTIRALIDHSGPDDTLLLYYSGHRQPFDNHLYLSARDTDGEDVYSTGLAATSISDYIAQRNRARSTIVVLDCCRMVRGQRKRNSAPTSAVFTS